MAVISLSLVACGSSSASNALSFKAGEYTAKAAGKNGDVEVKVTFDETSIKAIEVVSSNETAGLGDTAMDRISKAIIDGQTLAVDAVTGATLSSNAMLAAVEDCATQAGGNIELLKSTKSEQKSDKQNQEEVITTDIVIVGAGAAGLTAGISASSAGADVLIIEKGMNSAVSNGANAGGPIAVGTKIQAEEGEDLTLEKLYSHMSAFGNNTINDSLLHKTLAVTGETIDLLDDLGLDVYLRQDAYGVGFRARHGIREKGQDRMKFLEDEITKNGGELMFKTTGEEIILDDNGNAVGIKATKADGTKLTINALGNTLSTGDGINMVLAAGGREDKNWGIVANEFSASNAKNGTWSRESNQNLRFGIYGGLLVNGNGDRFFNEQIMASEPLSGAEASLRQGKYYAVVDDAYYQSVAKNGIWATLGAPESWVAGARNLSPEAPESKSHVKVLTEAPNQLQEAIDQGWAFKADTIEELAEHFGLDNLADTVARYNEMCAAGKDAGSLFTAPYYDNEGSAFGLSLGSGTLAGRNMASYVASIK